MNRVYLVVPINTDQEMMGIEFVYDMGAPVNKPSIVGTQSFTKFVKWHAELNSIGVEFRRRTVWQVL